MIVLASALLAALTVAAGEESSLKPADKKESFGAVVGPSTLPAGATAAYAHVGLPEVGIGFRQGVSVFEWEARARVDYLTLTASAELLGKYALYRWGKLDYSPYAGIGLTFSSGARYFDQQTFPFAGVRGLLGVALSYKVVDTVRLVARAEVPFDWPLGQGGGARLRALAGGGMEVYLADDVTVLALGQAGLDWIKEPLGVPAARLGYAIAVGLGVRLF